MFYKKLMLGITVSVLASNVVSANPVNGGNGSIALGGNIDMQSCVVGFDKNTVNIPLFTVQQINAAANSTQLYVEPFNLTLANCSVLGNSLEISALRDADPTIGAHLPDLAAGFTFSGSTITSSTTSPIYYRLLKGASGGSSTTHLSLNGVSVAADTINVGAATTFPMRIVVQKAAVNPVDANDYIGTFAGSFTYNISYP